MPPKQILIIDDENDIQEVARLSLQLTENWNVIGANGGAAGTLLALSSEPDAILLDVMMPDMDGPSTLRVLQHQGSTIPVIFLTAKVQPADRQKFMQLGVKGIISKPFDPLTLGKQIREMLAWG
ncbi:MAG TPA: response regulator [Thermoanaerobaculia bacterium]|jgi:DNA-binding response OmpR family regulator|nr:response regulator [Thermoanaerobaculia bacterium]